MFCSVISAKTHLLSDNKNWLPEIIKRMDNVLTFKPYNVAFGIEDIS